jgi:hypothetical protein
LITATVVGIVGFDLGPSGGSDENKGEQMIIALNC